MLYCVEMTVNIPRDIPLEQVEQIKIAEKARAIDIQNSGKWPHLWRVVGKYSNISIFDVESNDCLLYTSPSPRDATLSRMPSSA